jgi:hypothetical protein
MKKEVAYSEFVPIPRMIIGDLISVAQQGRHKLKAYRETQCKAFQIRYINAIFLRLHHGYIYM